MSKLLNLAVHWPSKVWPVGMIARKICSTIEMNDFKIHYTTGHLIIPKKYLSLVFLKSPNPRNRKSISVIKSKFLSASSMASLCSPFWKLLTRDVTSYWRADFTTDFLGDNPLPPSLVCKQLSVRFVQVYLIRRATFVSGLIVLQIIGTRNLRGRGGGVVALSWILLHLDLISNLRSYLF